MNKVWLTIDCTMNLSDEELDELLKFKRLNKSIGEKLLREAMFSLGKLYTTTVDYVTSSEKGVDISFEVLTSMTRDLLSDKSKDILRFKISKKEKLMEDIKVSLLKKVNIQEIFSEKVLEGLTQAIIYDEYEALLECNAEELKSLISHKVDMSNYDELTRLEKDLFIKIYAEKWGLETLGLSVIDWQDQFVDYIDYQEGASEEYEAFFNNFNQYNYLTLTN